MSNYITELERAVEELTQSEKPLQERLVWAYAKLSSFDLTRRPESGNRIGAELSKIMREVQDAGGASQLFGKMTDDQAKAYSQRIVSLYGEANKSK